MLSFKEYEQIATAIETMSAPIKHNEQVLVPRDYVLKLLKAFKVDVE